MATVEPRVAAAIAHARHLLEDGLPGWLAYHDLAHTTELVAPAAEDLGRAAGLDDRQLGLLAVAAWFHDVGFVERYADNEPIGAELAATTMAGLGFSPHDVEEVADAILATALPQSPTTELGRLLCDADLSVLGTERFAERDAGLRTELAHEGQDLDDDAWSRRQLAFLESHDWWTEAARARWAATKAAHVVAVRAQLEA